jgi:hypothetical protein
MNKTKLRFLVFLSLLLSSCQAIAGIFKAGIWVGVIGVVIVVGIILWLIGKAKK